MLTLTLVVVVVSAALILGAAWGLYGRLPDRTEGFLVALAGGALIVSVMSELIQPASAHLPLWGLSLAVALGAVGFTLADSALERASDGSEGKGLLLAITFDGVPENLALGVALIGTGAPEVAALAGSILLSNLPEAAGGAKRMAESGMSRGRVMALWVGTAGLLALAAVVGNLMLQDLGDAPLAAIRAIAAGAVTASLATEVFPQAYKEDHKATGIAVTLGLLIAFALSQLGG